MTDQHVANTCVANIRKSIREKEEKLISMKSEIDRFEDYIKRQAQSS